MILVIDNGDSFAYNIYQRGRGFSKCAGGEQFGGHI